MLSLGETSRSRSEIYAYTITLTVINGRQGSALKFGVPVMGNDRVVASIAVPLVYALAEGLKLKKVWLGAVLG